MRFQPFIVVLFVLAIGNFTVEASTCWSQNLTGDEEEEIETLDVIEVTGRTVEKALREFSFTPPKFPPKVPPPINHLLALPDIQVPKVLQATNKVLIDQTAQNQKIHQPVTPLKTEHPPYPRIAKEKGWQGRVIVRARITPQGTVKTASIHETSGFPVLDESALQAVKTWAFEPAKNGEFAVASTVDLPIQFDLLP